jgi:uncharacterized membrane protein YciS (DUF1049 family)
MFVIFDIMIAVGMVIEPIILVFRRKIKVATAKRQGKYECHIIFPSKQIEKKMLPMKNGRIEYTKGEMTYLWTIPPTAVGYTAEDGMPTLYLLTSNPEATNLSEVLYGLNEKERNRIMEALKEKNLTVAEPITIEPKPQSVTAHAMKIAASGLEWLSSVGIGKKDIKTFLLVIVIIIAIAAVALAAMAYQNTQILTSPGFQHLVAQATPAN